jgi:hypothetical protein
VDAFWYSVQGRYAEGTIALARAGEFEQMDGGFLGTSLSEGALPAVVRIYNADGREQDAQAMVARFGERLRNELAGRTPEAAQNVLLAGIATAEGKRALAVRHLQAAMKQVPLPDLFYPQLPWFKSLEGEPGYAEVVAELESRKAGMRAQIAALDSASPATR